MNKDLEIIKKQYGENFAKLCRKLFPTVLETDGLLSEIITAHFAPTRSLYDDLIQNKLEEKFESYIFSLVQQKENEIISDEEPEKLMKKAGYKLYKCETYEDIMQFKKYYSFGEELCTFYEDDRINTHLVFFAVKTNAKKLKRKKFTNPQREDEYGTSVISIQFRKGNNQSLSIKNRYNHTVENPYATF